MSRTINPVLRREMVERWRGRRAFVLLTVYVGILAGIVLLLYWLGHMFADSAGEPFGPVSIGPMLGRFLFENLLAFVLFLVLFITPGYAAAQISGERERRSLPLLQVTLLRPVDIAIGKLGAATAWMLLLILTALPFAAAAFFLGGVSAGDLLRSAAYLAVMAVSIAGMALGISSLTRRTTASVVLTYGLVLVLLVGSLFALTVELVLRNRDRPGGPASRPLSLYANPFFGLSDAAGVTPLTFGGEVPTVLTPFAFALPESPAFTQEFFGPAPGGVVGIGDPPRQGEPVWLVEMALFAVAGAGGVGLASRRLRPGAVRARPRTSRQTPSWEPPQGPGGSPPPGQPQFESRP